MPPNPGPSGEGEETAAYNSGCGKVTGEKAAIVCSPRGGRELLSQILSSAQAPAPAQEVLSWGGGSCDVMRELTLGLAL